MRRFSIIIFLLSLRLSLMAQTQGPILPDFANSMYKVVPPSPDAASLGKYGNIPVGMITGVPNITIPIFGIQVGGLTLPITLSYHGSGFRVDELSSNVGLGWTLLAAPQISRSVIGLPDDGSKGFLSGILPSYKTLSDSLPKYWKVVNDVAAGIVDSEQDIFTFSLGNINGKFLINKDKSIFQTPLTDNKIFYKNGNFQITNNKGERFFFEETEQTESKNLRYGSTGTYGSSTWHISKIIASNSVDTIKFTYTICKTPVIVNIDHYSSSIGSRPTVYATDPRAVTIGNEELPGTPEISTQQTIHNPKLLTSILFKNGKVEFKYECLRKDILGNGGARLYEVDIYNLVSSQYKLQKKVKLTQSYFYNGLGTNDYRNYKLRLDEVVFLDGQEKLQPQVYKVKYNNTPLSKSYGQDIWGFSNGKNSNQNLMPRTELFFNGKFYSFGNADRSTDTVALKAGIIEELSYPTGGRSVFQFQVHRYINEQYQWVYLHPAFSCSASSSVTPSGIPDNPCSTNFAITDEIKGAFIDCSISSYSNASTQRPEIILYNLTTGTKKIYQNFDVNSNYSFKEEIDLVKGNSYKLEVNVYPNYKSTVTASARISYYKKVNSPDIRREGGVRIMSITNYDSDGSMILKDDYKYGINENGYGTLLSDCRYLAYNYQDTKFSLGYSDFNGTSGSTFCTYHYGGPSRIYNSSSSFSISYVSGSPVVYGTVTKYQTSNLGSHNGKEIYQFQVVKDGGFPINPYFNQLSTQLISNSWKNGNLRKREVYKKTSSGYAIVEMLENFYTDTRKASIEGIKVKRKSIHSGCEITSSEFTRNDYVFSDYPINTSVIILDSTYIQRFDDNSNKVFTYEKFLYENTSHLNPTKKRTINSKGEVVIELFKYPHDYSGTPVYQKMISRNLISSPIQYQKQVNGKAVATTKINFKDWFNNSNLIVPDSIQLQSSSTLVDPSGTIPFVTTLKFHNYDKFGNILEQSKAGDSRIVYLWGYKNQYPVAEIKNSTYSDVRNILGQTYIDQLNDNPSTDLLIREKFQQLRGNPLMKSTMINCYTYLPLIGTTSQTDHNGITTYFDYDLLGRLQRIRDKDNNIIKLYQYNYQIK